MILYEVTVTLDGVTVRELGHPDPVDTFALDDTGTTIHALNTLLWNHGWSNAGPWRADTGRSSMRLVTTALRRG